MDCSIGHAAALARMLMPGDKSCGEQNSEADALKKNPPCWNLIQQLESLFKAPERCALGCITARAFGKRGWLAVNDINHAHARRVVEAFEVLLREILRRPGEDTSNSSCQTQFFKFVVPRAVSWTHSEGITPFDTWTDIIAKSVRPSRVCQVFLVAIELTVQVEPAVAA